MIRIRQTTSGRLTQVAAAGALAAVAGLAGVLVTGSAASGSPAVSTAAAAKTPAWRMQTAPDPAGTTDQVFGDVSCSSASACQAIALNDFPKNDNIGNFAETWNGAHWAARTVPNGKGRVYLYSVNCRSAHWCVAVGALPAVPPMPGDYVPVADRWNGSAWTQVLPPAPASATTSQLGAVACSGTTACTAIGQSLRATGAAPRLLVERWNGSAWKIQSAPQAAGGGLLTAVACPAAHACRAVGSGSNGLFSEVWNGSSWTIKPVPVPGDGGRAELNGISCTAADSCEAVGKYELGIRFLPLAEAWNGSRWRAQTPAAVPGEAEAGLNAVSCLSATNCEAAGNAGVAEGPQEVGVLEKWNGKTWSVQKKVLPSGDLLASLNGISCTAGPVCETVGFHGKSVNKNQLLVLRYSS